jgi:hypothetical protein
MNMTLQIAGIAVFLLALGYIFRKGTRRTNRKSAEKNNEINYDPTYGSSGHVSNDAHDFIE